MNKNFEIKKSKISGLGLFTKRSFKKNEVVLKWDVEDRITKEEFNNLSEEAKKYTHPYVDGTYIKMQSEAKYINHSCNNNTIVKDFSDIAIKDIKIGEEITSNYSLDGGNQNFKCTCNTKTCIGYLY